MSETKKKTPPAQRKIISASTGEEIKKSAGTAGAPPEGKKRRAGGLRIAAAALWVLAIAAEAVALLMLTKYLYVPPESLLTRLIAALAVDLALVIAASQLWKRANHIDPASEANKLKFWLWNNMGVFVSVVAFLPILILLLSDKELDPKTKQVASVVAAVALAFGIGTSYDWNPASQEALASAQAQAEAINAGEVCWTTFGHKYHLYVDCSSLTYSENFYVGTVDQAFEAGRVDVCKICEKRAEAGEIAPPIPADGYEENLDDAVDEAADNDMDADVPDAA
ncbi:MAG: hypothetical protein FWF69_01320 [Firmicutes bacterium]|nr:hypothetical protein [Bacillota bacterium]